MRARFWVLLFGGALLSVLAMNTRMFGEKLVVEDGKSAATELPLDRESSKVKFETATFGLG